MSRRLILMAAIALAASACVGASGETTTTASPPASTSSTTSQPSSSTTTSLGTTTTTEPDLTGLVGLTEEAQEQLASLILVAQEIREMVFVSTPTIVVVTPEELASRARDGLELDDLPADQALYRLLGLLDEDTDLEVLLLDVFGASVAGFYDLDAEEIVVPAREEGFSLLQQSTLVHELVHALTDQNLDIHGPYEEMIDDERYDEAGAYQALLEGDASLAEYLWLQTLSRRELGQLLAESLEIDLSPLQGAPEFIQDSLIFPYDSGLVFVQDLYERGGWDEVNAAYQGFLGFPPSTEQVITPDDYGRDLPVEVSLPEIELEGYELAASSVWGEAGFRIMLNQVLGSSTAARAADGWGGDHYYQWFDGTRAAFLIGYRGDTLAELRELEEALLDFAVASVPEEDFVWVEEVEGTLYFIAADDADVGRFIRAAVGAG